MENKPVSLGRLEDLPSFGVRLAYSYFLVAWSKDVQALGVTPIEFSVLATIEANDPVSARDISKRLNIAVPNVVALISRMVKAGYVFRNKDKRDGRRQLLSLTSVGHKLVDDIYHTIKRADEVVAQKLTPLELAQLTRLLKRLQGSAGDA